MEILTLPEDPATALPEPISILPEDAPPSVATRTELVEDSEPLTTSKFFK